MNLKDKVIAITGGGRGLGAAMATRLASQGCRIALIDVDEDTLAASKSACESAGAPEVIAYDVNVASEPDVEKLFADIADDFGALHGLVNNAGITRDALTLKYRDGELVSKMTLDQWQLVIDVNLTGVFLCGREAAARMIELGCDGCIINISSISRHGNIGQVNYSATKAGVKAMAVVWAREFARYGIRAAAISPGFIETEMVRAMKPEALERTLAQVPLRRPGDPDHIAQTVQFILENDYVSGRSFDIDGGLRI